MKGDWVGGMWYHMWNHQHDQSLIHCMIHCESLDLAIQMAMDHLSLVSSIFGAQ